MQYKDFRELDIDLPRQPVANQRPWMIGGLLLALAILVMAACAYLQYKKTTTVIKPTSSLQATKTSGKII